MTDQKLPEGFKPGLEGVVAGVSKISQVNPEKDALIYRGYPAHELAEKGTYSEVAYLLLHGALPKQEELNRFRKELAGERAIPQELLEIFKRLPKTANPMALMSLAVNVLAMSDPDAESNETGANFRKAKRLIAKSPTIVAAIHRVRNGEEPLAPRADLRPTANFLYMTTGKEPDPEVARAFDSTMILYAEHGYNASTFSALVGASTLSDMHSAVSAAIGTLKGPLHGGANEGAIETLLKIGEEKNLEPWLKNALANKEKIMGFGHRVYSKQDSRAPYMKKLAEMTARRVGDTKIFPLSCRLEEAMMREKKLFPNVDFHAAVFYYLLGLPVSLDTTMFAMARMAGWTAHVIEQHAANRLIRPTCVYDGEKGLSFIPVEKR